MCETTWTCDEHGYLIENRDKPGGPDCVYLLAGLGAKAAQMNGSAIATRLDALVADLATAREAERIQSMRADDVGAELEGVREERDQAMAEVERIRNISLPFSRSYRADEADAYAEYWERRAAEMDGWCRKARGQLVNMDSDRMYAEEAVRNAIDGVVYYP